MCFVYCYVRREYKRKNYIEVYLMSILIGIQYDALSSLRIGRENGALNLHDPSKPLLLPRLSLLFCEKSNESRGIERREHSRQF